MEKDTMKMLNVELFKFEEWDEIDTDIQQFYDVKWKLETFKKYNGHMISFTWNGDIEIYDEDGIEVIEKINLSKVPEFISKLIKD